MTNSSAQNDTMTLVFINPVTDVVVGDITIHVTSGESINNYTQINLEKDFFTPSNGMTVILEDDRVYQLTNVLQRGIRVQISVNGNLNMIAYIFDYHITYSRNGGTQLTLHCMDLLHYLEQGTMFPNMGKDAKTNVHFSEKDTFSKAMSDIALSFIKTSSTKPDVIISTDDSADLTFSTGGRVGLKIKGKSPKGRQKSLSNSLNHLTTPYKTESFLAYMSRIAKHIGCNIKMSDTVVNKIIIAPPTYDRTEPTPFKLIHYLNAPNNISNNVLSASFKFSLERQPSVVVVEATTQGDGKFYQGALKGIAVNELTAFDLETAAAGGGPPFVPIPSVSDAVAILTNANLGTGYVLAPFNEQLFRQRFNFAIDIKTEVSMPFYTLDSNAHNKDEVSFAASKILAEQQDKYMEFTYRVQGWSMAGTNRVWQPNMMVEITEEIFRPGGTAYAKFPMWIRKVNFLKSRNGGTETEITCTLPYTHNFEITP